MRTLRALPQLLGPVVLIVAVALIGKSTSLSTQQDFLQALVMVTIVIALYVFIGNSGVISLGHVSFVALGAFAAGVLTVPAGIRTSVLPDLFGFLSTPELTSLESLLLAAGLGAVYALLVGVPLMRLSGLAAGIATFAVLEITHNVLRYSDKIGPGANTLSLVPQTVGFFQAALCASIAAAIAFAYQRSRPGRRLRATREDPHAAQAIGIDIHRLRLGAFVLSGALAGLGGALFVHMLGSIDTEQVYLDLTLLTLAMLVIGGTFSLWGAVLGAILISLLDSLLGNVENGVSLGFARLTLPAGSSVVILGALMTLFLLFRPSGITNSVEISLPRRLRRPRAAFSRPRFRRARD